MVSRRDFILSGLAAAGSMPFTNAANADDSRSVSTNMAEEMVRHVDWFLYSAKGITPESLQNDVSAESWNATEIAGAFATSWEHLKDSPSAQQIIDDYKNNDGKRFFAAFLKPNGIVNQSGPRFINEMFSSNAVRAANSLANGKGKGRNFELVHDTPFQAYLLNIESNPAAGESFNAIATHAVAQWQEGFRIFVEETLIPELNQATPTQEATPIPLNFGNPKQP